MKVLYRIFRWFAVRALVLVAAYYLACTACLFAFRYVMPFSTGVQAQRRVEALFRRAPYHKRYTPVPLERISADLQHAVIAAEDGSFYRHAGFDWKELQKVVDADLEEGQLGRGGSTITQQLVKNLFLTTHRSLIRKGVEFTLTPLAEKILGKRRILELYLNVIEWGPGVWGAEAAARTWYGVPASAVTRAQGARLAAIIPSPRKRKPARMSQYGAEIERRMGSMGW